VQFEFLVYDVTNTFFEGMAVCNQSARQPEGGARVFAGDQRGDCKQVCIGVVCTPEGLPLNY